MSTEIDATSEATAAAPEQKPPVAKFFAPVHLECPARPHGSEPAKFYIVEGLAEQVWACEGCAALVRLELQTVEVAAPVEDLAAAATAQVTRPAQELGPRALLYDPLRQTFRVGGLDRLIQRIGGEVQAATPDRDEPLTTWGLARHPATPLTQAERLAVSAFMAGRWWAWAHASCHDQVLQRPGPSRIVRPN